MSISSGFAPSSAARLRGSSAIPQIGQSPGFSRTISGCIGHQYSVLTGGTWLASGSSAIPHSGQLPGIGLRTSGCMGQV